jgi:transcriptional regulator with XRE-family HTH domain
VTGWAPSWDRRDERQLLRAVDAAVALLSCGVAGTDAGRLALRRLLAAIFEAGPAGSSDPPTELAEAENQLFAVPVAQLRSEPAARAWVRRAHQQRVGSHELDVREAGFEPDDLSRHRCWKVHQLDAFARRLRLLQTALKLTTVTVADRVGVPVHQVRHWADNDAKPTTQMRVALAEALGVHPDWFDARRDQVADICLYRFRQCPCGTDAALRFDLLDPRPPYIVGSEPTGGHGLWCADCGQPYVSDHIPGFDPSSVEHLAQAHPFERRHL